MGFSNSNQAFSLSLSLLIFSLLLQTTISLDPLYTICSNSPNQTANTSYRISLKVTLGQLYRKAPASGFGLASFGQSGARTYGLALCRGDVSSRDCAACLGEASSAITRSCSNNRTAIIWYDNCYLKYSDNNFFGKIDNQNRFSMWNTRDLSNKTADISEFNEKTKDLLNELAEEASESKRMYAKGEVKIGDYKIYGMGQCSRDLSESDCGKCIEDAVKELPSCCDGKVGGRVVGGSCSIRYEMYPFLAA